MLILKVLEIDLATTFHEIFGLCRNIKQLFIYINKCRHTYIYIDMACSQLIGLHLLVFEHLFYTFVPLFFSYENITVFLLKVWLGHCCHCFVFNSSK